MLSQPQRNMIDRARKETGARLMPPDGYPTAGRDASAFWRTAESLIRKGLMQRPASTMMAVELTLEGLDLPTTKV